MSDRSSFTQTTLELTLDVPALAALSSAVTDQLNRLQGSLKRTVNVERRQAIENTITNLKTAEAEFDRLYREALKQPLFTADHEARIDQAIMELGSDE